MSDDGTKELTMKYVFSFMLVVAIALTAMFVFPAAPAKAVVPVFDMGLLTNTVSQDHNVKSEQRRAAAGSPTLLSPDPASSAPQLSPSVLRYRPSIEERRDNLASFVEKTRRVDPASAEIMERDFATKDIIGNMERAIAPYGFEITNVSHAYAYWWITAWSAVSDPTVDFSDTQVDAVKRQSADAMLAIPQFGELSNAQKQELAEVYLVQAAQIAATVAHHQGDPVQTRAVAEAIKEGASKSGMDLDKMVLTESGFELR
ncbi:DUF6683 family protein [Qipengyuania qiaonensis]|uniref:Uncharacterized protein n=1 Tax=Qipengyuania qiaonensis TaxID=2867240 RepID=A0ABS7J9U6_9SPHN|nr:DUF6683 family protein [Qipengyuania qiaonensis]MBX7482745.1 hypothetical protein [Qipengyuania qiaonensis]